MGLERHFRRRTPEVAAYAAENGWELVGLNGRGHFKMRHTETGRSATMAQSASDVRAQKNTISWMRKLEAGTAALR